MDGFLLLKDLFKFSLPIPSPYFTISLNVTFATHLWRTFYLIFNVIVTRINIYELNVILAFNKNNPCIHAKRFSQSESKFSEKSRKLQKDAAVYIVQKLARCSALYAEWKNPSQARAGNDTV